MNTVPAMVKTPRPASTINVGQRFFWANTVRTNRLEQSVVGPHQATLRPVRSHSTGGALAGYQPITFGNVALTGFGFPQQKRPSARWARPDRYEVASHSSLATAHCMCDRPPVTTQRHLVPKSPRSWISDSHKQGWTPATEARASCRRS